MVLARLAFGRPDVAVAVAVLVAVLGSRSSCDGRRAQPIRLAAWLLFGLDESVL